MTEEQNIDFLPVTIPGFACVKSSFEEELSKATFEQRNLFPFICVEVHNSNGLSYEDGAFVAVLKPIWDAYINETGEYKEFIANARCQQILYRRNNYLISKPTYHMMQNDILINQMQSCNVFNHDDAFSVRVLPANNQHKETVMQYQLSTTTPDKTNITEYERQINDSLLSIWKQSQKENNPCIFTLDMVCENMPGGGRAGTKTKIEIESFMRAFELIYVDKLDYTAEMLARGFPADNRYDISGYNCRFMKITATPNGGGKPCSAYYLPQEPLIWKHSLDVGHYLHMPRKFMEPTTIEGKRLRVSQERQALQGYLMRRILELKATWGEAVKKKRSGDAYARRTRKEFKPIEFYIKGNNKKNAILFDNLFYQCDLGTLSKPQRNKHLKDFIYPLLDAWKKEGLFKDYKKRIVKQEVVGIEITFDN